MPWQPSVIQKNGKDYIFCEWRHKYVCLTPEEGVRQQMLHYLVDECHYPISRIGVEIQLTTGLRADAVVYDSVLQPWLIIEFKAPTVSLSQRTLDQIAVYNRELKVPYLMLSNGASTLVARVTEKLEFLTSIPEWKQS